MNARAMVDKASRSAVVSLLEGIFRGQLTNFGLEDQWPQESHDRFIAELPEILWPYYDDQPETLLKPEQFGDDGEAFLRRIILFLKSDRDYEWPIWKPSIHRASAVGRLFGWFIKGGEDIASFKTHGDFDVWPFARMADYEACAFQAAP